MVIPQFSLASIKNPLFGFTVADKGDLILDMGNSFIIPSSIGRPEITLKILSHVAISFYAHIFCPFSAVFFPAPFKEFKILI